jgi:hypothetical protein
MASPFDRTHNLSISLFPSHRLVKARRALTAIDPQYIDVISLMPENQRGL